MPEDKYLLKQPRFDSYEESAQWARAFLADLSKDEREKFDELVEVAMRSYTASFNKERPAHLYAFDIERFVLEAYSNELNEEFIRERDSKDE